MALTIARRLSRSTRRTRRTRSSVALVTARRIALGLALLAPAGPLGAQASPYVPLDDVAYDYIDALQSRGVLTSLPALTRPYTAAAVRAALDSARAGGVDGVPGAWLERLGEVVAKHEAASAAGDAVLRVGLTPLLTAQSSGRRELMLADDESAVVPGVAVRGAFAAGPVVAASRVLFDNRLKEDPDYHGWTDRALAARIEDAYVAGQWRYAELFFGRLSRNWGPPGLSGLALGDDPYSYDHLALRLGADRLGLRLVAAKLDPLELAADSVAERWFAAHRVEGRWRSLELAAGETVVYGGVGRQLEPTLLNPLAVWNFAQYDQDQRLNVAYTIEGAWRTRVGRFTVQFLLDDVQVDDCEGGCDEPPSYGLTIVADGLPLVGDQRWFASYTQVTNLAYRTPTPWERYSSRLVGLGRAFSDHDEVRVGLDLALLDAAPLRLYAAVRRQGEGDWRTPFPEIAEYPSTPTIFEGTVSRVTRVAVSGGGRVAGLLEISGDVGMNRRDRVNAYVASEGTELEGRVRVELTPAWLWWTGTP